MHPRHDVLFFKNAEGESYKQTYLSPPSGRSVVHQSRRSIHVGSARCVVILLFPPILLITSLTQWARQNPTMKATQNPGWPGCCRPPAANENKQVQIADWPAVSVIHHVPIPGDVRALLESLGQRIPPFAQNVVNTRGVFPSSQPPSISRRGSAVVASALRGEIMPVKSASLPIPVKLRGGGSPQQVVSPLVNNPSRTSLESSPGSTVSTNSMDQIVLPRRPAVDTQPEKRRDNSRESKQSPGRKHAELNGTLSRRASTQRPSLSAVVAVAKSNNDTPRKGSGGNPSPPPTNSIRGTDRTHERNTSTSTLRQRSPLDLEVAGLSIRSGSSSASSDSGDGSETTVISDGGFTDYLSDESEAELQRQAEIRAAIIAQTQVEEQEFRAARQQLANVDLRPPKSWTSNVNSTPRSQHAAPPTNGSAYGTQQFAASPYAGQTAAQSRV